MLSVYGRRGRGRYARKRRIVKRRVVRRRPMAGKRKRRTTYTRTKRRKASYTSSNFEYSKMKDTFGKYGKRTLRQAFKELRAGQEKTVFRWNRIAPFNGQGDLWMSNKTDANGDRYCPLFIFDLTSVNQAYRSAYPMQWMKMSGTGDVSFISVPGTNQVGTYQLQWQIDTDERAGVNTIGQIGARSMLKWISIKLNCWGAKNHATKWCIQMVSLRDDSLDPYIPTNYDPTNVKFNGFWQSMVKPYMFNPIADQGYNNTRDMKVHKTWMFVQNGNQSTELDQAPQVKEIKLFKRCNQLCKWDEFIGLENTAGAVADTSNFVKGDDSANNCYLKPRYKKYLLIRALNAGLDASDTNADTPSIDVNIKTCHMTLD